MTPWDGFLADRADKIATVGTCLLWLGARQETGYGRATLHGRKWATHRLAYTLAIGPIPSDREVDHRCHNRACMNPDHLRLADRVQNSRSRAGANTNSKSGVRNVHWHSRTKKWCVQVRVNGRITNFGYFHDLRDAESCAIAARAAHYGAFAGKG